MTAFRTKQPVLILDGRDAAILIQVGRLNEARIKARGRDERAYQVLLAIHETALEWRTSVDGKAALGMSRREESNKWVTPDDLAQELDVTSRTIRNDIAAGLLPATKQKRFWFIDPADAKTYIAARRPS
jgi:hypothetical protein